MEIQCKCGSTNTAPIRSIVTQAETGRWKCKDCLTVFTPQDEARQVVNLQERIEVLTASRRQLESRLLGVSIPHEMIAQAEKFERMAEEMYDKAQRIRATLVNDTRDVHEILSQAEMIDLEIMACRACQQSRMVASKGMLRNVVEMFRTRKGKEE